MIVSSNKALMILISFPSHTFVTKILDSNSHQSHPLQILAVKTEHARLQLLANKNKISLPSLTKNITSTTLEYFHLCAHLQALPSVMAMVIFAWLVEQTLMRGEWRCVSMECGGLWWVLVGTPEMLPWCAGNLDTRTHVSETSWAACAMNTLSVVSTHRNWFCTRGIHLWKWHTLLLPYLVQLI